MFLGTLRRWKSPASCHLSQLDLSNSKESSLVEAIIKVSSLKQIGNFIARGCCSTLFSFHSFLLSFPVSSFSAFAAKKFFIPPARRQTIRDAFEEEDFWQKSGSLKGPSVVFEIGKPRRRHESGRKVVLGTHSMRRSIDEVRVEPIITLSEQFNGVRQSIFASNQFCLESSMSTGFFLLNPLEQDWSLLFSSSHSAKEFHWLPPWNAFSSVDER